MEPWKRAFETVSLYMFIRVYQAINAGFLLPFLPGSALAVPRRGRRNKTPLPQELSSPCQGLVPTPPAPGALAGGSLALFVVSAIPGMVCTLTALPLRSGSLVASKSLREALSVYYSKQVPEPHRE